MSDYAHKILLIINCAIALICLYTIVHLLSKNRSHNKWLIIAFLAMAWPSFFRVLNNDFNLFEEASPIRNPASYIAVIPAVYLYLHNLVFPRPKVNWKEFLHFIPFVAGTIFSASYTVPTVPDVNNPRFLVFFIVMNLIIFPSTIVYIILIFRVIKQNKGKYVKYYSYDNTFTSLSWVPKFIWTLLATVVVGIILSFVFPYSPHFPPAAYMMLIIFIYAFILSFHGIRQPTLFINEEQSQIESTDSEITEPQIKEIDPIIIELEEYMSKYRPYLNSTIRIHDLAQALKVPPHKLSKAINGSFGVNFFNFINMHRVEYVKTLLDSEEHKTYTIESIGEKAGFNSTSTFYKSFKKVTGQNPKSYLDEK